MKATIIILFFSLAVFSKKGFAQSAEYEPTFFPGIGIGLPNCDFKCTFNDDDESDREETTWESPEEVRKDAEEKAAAHFLDKDVRADGSLWMTNSRFGLRMWEASRICGLSNYKLNFPRVEGYQSHGVQETAPSLPKIDENKAYWVAGEQIQYFIAYKNKIFPQTENWQRVMDDGTPIDVVCIK